MQRVRDGTRPRHQRCQEHPRGRTWPSCRRNPRPFRASRGSRRLRAGRTSKPCRSHFAAVSLFVNTPSSKAPLTGSLSGEYEDANTSNLAEKASRALRRHHAARLRAQRRFYHGQDLAAIRGALGRVVNTAAGCSCFMCGNPRRYFRERTLQECRAENIFRDGLTESE